MSEYIAEAQGLWYEGTRAWLRLVQVHPIILPFAIVTEQNGPERVFFEDYFNSSTRIRRGRLFVRDGNDVWQANAVSRFPHRDLHNAVNAFSVNRAYRAVDALLKPGTEVELGGGGASSRWLVALMERIGLECGFVTLKSKTSFGVLPEILVDRVPETNRTDVLNAVDAVVEAASIQSPQSAIDACRNAACHVITAAVHEANQSGKDDLGPMVKWLNEHGQRMRGAAAEAINCLHSRAKANAGRALETRAVSRRDAELAVNALAFLLQDFEWAVSD